jgi:uncharacterized RDD family membrane protein YckC
MSERPDESSGFTSGDPLAGREDPPPPPDLPPLPPDLADAPAGPFGPSSSDPLPEAPIPPPVPPPPPVEPPPAPPIPPPATPPPPADPIPPAAGEPSRSVIPQIDGPGALPEAPIPGVPPSPSPAPSPAPAPSPRADSGLPGEPSPAPSRLADPGLPGSSPSGGGLWGSGDPLGATSPAAGYTTPPPPGAGGLAPRASSSPAAGQFVLASWGSRVGAQMIDGLIVFVGAIILFFIVEAVFSLGFAAGDEAGVVSIVVGLIIWSVCVAIIALLYAPTLMARTNGQTWGRQVMNIRVVRAKGEPMTFGFAVVREVLVKSLGVGVISGITFGLFYFVDVLWPLWDEENRALHDFAVNTRVVKA